MQRYDLMFLAGVGLVIGAVLLGGILGQYVARRTGYAYLRKLREE